MKLKALISSVLLIAASITAAAQSPAKQVKDIQNNTAEYISAESTDPTEASARSNAMRQMIDMSRNFVQTNNNGAQISDKAIESAVKSIVITRGEFKRVFLYASRADLLSLSNTSGAAPAATAKKAEPEIATAEFDFDDNTLTEDTKNTKESENEIKKEESQKTVAKSSEDKKMPAWRARHSKKKDGNSQTTAKSSKTSEGAKDSNEDFARNVSPAITAEINSSSAVPPALQELIGLIHKSTSLNEAARHIDRFKNRGVIADYGAPRECRRSAACYWVVEDGGTISVLGPEIRGHRKNFRTDSPDALHRYENGLWFIKRN